MKEITLELIYNALLEFKKEVNERFEAVDKRFETIDKRFDENDVNYDLRFKSIEERLSSLERITTKMEYEHGRKLDILLDYAQANIEKHAQYDQEFFDIHAQLFDHSNRIEILEEAFQKAQ